MEKTDSVGQAIVVTETGTQIVPNTADLIAWMEARGYSFDGLTSSSGPLRRELSGQPKFKGLCGPMWGGSDYPLRYESWTTYEKLSR